jgi:hypothetical protein
MKQKQQWLSVRVAGFVLAGSVAGLVNSPLAAASPLQKVPQRPATVRTQNVIWTEGKSARKVPVILPARLAPVKKAVPAKQSVPVRRWGILFSD